MSNKPGKNKRRRQRVKTRTKKIKVPGNYSTTECWCGKLATTGGLCKKHLRG